MARRIFRESALNRYNERMEKIELPRYATAPWAALGWLGVLLFLTVTGLLLTVQLPEYAVGTGVVVDGAAVNQGAGLSTHDALVAVFLPAEYATQVTAGQPVELTLPTIAPGAAEAVPTRVRSVEPALLSPAEARARFGLDAAVGARLNGPVVVAVLDVALPGGLWLGSVGEAQIELGSRSVLSLLPRLLLGEAGLDSGGAE